MAAMQNHLPDHILMQSCLRLVQGRAQSKAVGPCRPGSMCLGMQSVRATYGYSC